MSDNPITWHNIDDLQQWEKNPNEGDIGAIIQSIKQFGYNDISAIWQHTIKGGNHRIQALQQLRKTKWHPDKCDNPSQFLIADNGIWKVGCFDVSHMSEQESNAFALALNRTSRLGYDDPGSLLQILEDINTSMPDILDATGYAAEDMDYLQDISEKQRELKMPISASRVLGDDSKKIKPVLYVEEVATFEKALRLTKERNRGMALIKICAEYIANHE